VPTCAAAAPVKSTPATHTVTRRVIDLYCMMGLPNALWTSRQGLPGELPMTLKTPDSARVLARLSGTLRSASCHATGPARPRARLPEGHERIHVIRPLSSACARCAGPGLDIPLNAGVNVIFARLRVTAL